MPRYVDTHCHLNHERFAGQAAAVLQRAAAVGVERVVVIGCDVPSSRWAVELAAEHPGVFAAVGLHPHSAGEWSASTERELRELAGHRKVVALGEMGLDFYRDRAPRPAQVLVFRAQLALAAELGLPVVVHTRESMPEALAELEGPAVAGLRGVLHCFSGGVEEARHAVALGLHLGVGGVLTYPRPGELPAVAVAVPLERLLLETDAPYLPPVPHRGRTNEPAYVPLVAHRLAALRGCPVETVAAATTTAAAALFGLEEG